MQLISKIKFTLKDADDNLQKCISVEENYDLEDTK